jgi:hypothetical protein
MQVVDASSKAEGLETGVGVEEGRSMVESVQHRRVVVWVEFIRRNASAGLPPYISALRALSALHLKGLPWTRAFSMSFMTHHG